MKCPELACFRLGYNEDELSHPHRLLNGAKSTRIHGEEFPVRARIASLHALSGHADHGELLRWLGRFERPPQQTFIVHGEPEASQAHQDDLKQWGWHTVIPAQEAVFSIR